MSPQGIIVVNKDFGISSFQVVARLRKMFKMKRIGHCGTLDPFATGVLPLALDRGTAAIQFMEKYAKSYVVLAVLGTATDTYDIEGEISASIPTEELEELYTSGKLAERLKEVLPHFSGSIEQVPPMYSAIKHQGKALYKYAREGQEIEREAREIEVEIKDLALFDKTLLEEILAKKNFTLPQALKEDSTVFLYAELAVSKGTYIRSWVHDLGKALTVNAYAAALKRTVCGPYTLDDKSLSTEELFALQDKTELKGQDYFAYLDEIGVIRKLITAFSDFPKLELSLAEAKDLSNGKRVKVAMSRLHNVLSNEDEINFQNYSFAPLLCYYKEQAVAVVEPRQEGKSYLLKIRRVFAQDGDFS